MKVCNEKKSSIALIYYPILLLLPIYILFTFFPEVVNYPLSETPPASYFPSYNNYWSLGNTGIEPLLLTAFVLLYIILNLYLIKKNILFFLKANKRIRQNLSFLFLTVFLLLWIVSNFNTSGFYWQFKEYVFDDFKSWLFILVFIALFNISISNNNSSRTLFAYTILIFFCAIVPVGFLQQYDFEFFAIPTLGILDKADFSKIYFQYDLLIPILLALWTKLNFEIYNFYIFLNIILFIYLLGVYKILKYLINHKYLFSLAVFSIIFLRFYLIDMKFGSVFPQYSPLRADLWLPLILLAAIYGIRSKALFFSLLFVLVVSFNMGILYFVSYFLTLIILKIFEEDQGLLKTISLWLKNNLVRLGAFLLVLILVYSTVYSYGENIGTKQFLKYSIQSNKIQPFSIIWLSILLIGLLASKISSNVSRIDKRKLELYIFLIFLTVANFTFCFYKNTMLSFISVSTSFIILFFIYIDLNSKYLSNIFKPVLQFKILRLLPVLLLLFPLAFNKYGVPTILNNQYRFIKSNSMFKAKRINTDIRQIEELRRLLVGKDKVLFYGAGSYIQYFELGITPDDFFSFTTNIYNQKEYKSFLKSKVEKGFLLIFPKSKVTPWGYPRKEFFDFWNSILADNEEFSTFSVEKFEVIYLKSFYTF